MARESLRESLGVGEVVLVETPPADARAVGAWVERLAADDFPPRPRWGERAPARRARSAA